MLTLPHYAGGTDLREYALNFVLDVAGGCFLVATPIAVCIIIEHIGAIERYSLRARWPGIAMNLVQVPLTIIAAWPIWNFCRWIGTGRIPKIPLTSWLAPLGAIGFVVEVLVLVMVADFLAYWRHRLEHRLFWRIHSVHHAPTELHAANSIAHPLSNWYTIAVIGIPMSLIDNAAIPGVVSFIIILLTGYIHSPIDVHFGPLRAILVDNRFHRIHHSTEAHHFDKNFGICFSLWDRWFGTACDPKPDEWPNVGLADVDPPKTIRDYLFMPFKAPQIAEATPLPE